MIPLDAPLGRIVVRQQACEQTFSLLLVVRNRRVKWERAVDAPFWRIPLR
jgi:hypothetical protein